MAVLNPAIRITYPIIQDMTQCFDISLRYLALRTLRDVRISRLFKINSYLEFEEFSSRSRFEVLHEWHNIIRQLTK
jgi:hypothetical protein